MYAPALGFEYFMDDLLSEDMSTLPEMSPLPRTMDGFEFLSEPYRFPHVGYLRRDVL